MGVKNKILLKKKILWPVSQLGGDGEAGSTTSASMVSLRELVMHNAQCDVVAAAIRKHDNDHLGDLISYKELSIS